MKKLKPNLSEQLQRQMNEAAGVFSWILNECGSEK